MANVTAGVTTTPTTTAAATTTALKPGDVVMLKGGGPRSTRMTVETFDDKIGKVGCVWFSRDGLVHRDSFVVAALQAAAAVPR